MREWGWFEIGKNGGHCRLIQRARVFEIIDRRRNNGLDRITFLRRQFSSFKFKRDF